MNFADRIRVRLREQPEDLLPAAARMGAFVGRRLIGNFANSRAALSPRYWEHYGVHSPRNNAGDTVLFRVIEDLFDASLGRHLWHRSQLRSEVAATEVSRLNKHAAAILVGGGGLLISDTNPNTQSGWQWRIGLKELESITAPLVVFAVGYNQFRGEAEFPAIFEEHLAATVSKASFFGMRNRGSIERTCAHLPSNLHAKVAFQPCMTTVLRKFHPAILTRPKARDERRLALNLAFDRADKRYGGGFYAIGEKVVRAMRWAIDDGWSITLALHAWDDDPVVPLFKKAGLPVAIKRLNLSSSNEIIKFYNDMPLTIGMRGHAQMIPFGCGNAILSLVSHDKLGFFLDDIVHPEWGVEIHSSDLDSKIIDGIRNFDKNRMRIASETEEAQEKLWHVTKANLAIIAGATSPA